MSFIREFLKKAGEKIREVFTKETALEREERVISEYWDKYEPRETFKEYDTAVKKIGEDYGWEYGDAKRMVDDIMRLPYEELDSYEKEIYESISPRKGH